MNNNHSEAAGRKAAVAQRVEAVVVQPLLLLVRPLLQPLLRPPRDRGHDAHLVTARPKAASQART